MALLQITIHNSPQIETEIAEAVLAKLGLTSNQLRQEFYGTYGYKNLLEFFQKVLHDPKNAQSLANIAKTVKKAGKVTFSFEVSDKLISDVKEFFALRENKFSDRVNDAARQENTAIVNALDGVKKNQAEAFNDMDKGLGRTVAGLWNSLTEPVGSKRFGEGIDDVRNGLYQFGGGVLKYNIQTPLDAGLMYFGGGVDARQTLLGTNIGRSLNLVEMQILRDVFGQSLVLDVIRIKQGYAGLYNVGDDGGLTLTNNQRAITRGNTIYMKNKTPGSTDWKSTLVHEATHVWQNQNGGTDYMSEALHAQIFGDGYDYAGAIKNQGKTWAMLNPEQQGQLVQDAYDNNFFINQVWLNSITYNGVTISAQDMTVFMKTVLPQILSGQGAT